MGWERKRGKIEEFNRLVLGHTDTSFVVQVGEVSVIPRCRYVITLDADTQLPPDSARRLVGTIAHPLNRPRFDVGAGRVTEGYGVLQPRVEISLPSASRSWFARVMSGHVGWDPYTTAASDVYQDLFHEGSYVGKGIYDPRAFHAALAGRVRRQHAAQPRPVRGLLRARGTGGRRPPGGRLPEPLPHVGRAPAPVGARRLADCRLARPDRRRRRRRARAQPAAGPGALEDPGQPAAKPVVAVAGAAAGAGVDGLAGVGVHLDVAVAAGPGLSRVPADWASRSTAACAACRSASTCAASRPT